MNDRPIPRATYRLQLNKDFRFADVERLAPYLGRLGVSHAYLSPILKARAGSTHGYDTVDHGMLNPELGTRDDFRRMAAALRAQGVGIVLDIVPNHMGIGGTENAFWLDVLEWGSASPYAEWFDIDWEPSEPSLRGKVLVPFLGSAFGEALGTGRLELRYDEAEGAFAVWAEGTHKLPLLPRTYSDVLGRASEQLLELGSRFATTTARDDAILLKQQLARAYRAVPGLGPHLDERVAELNGEAGRAELARIIDLQHWQPARFSVAADDINYRRFFIVSDLAAIRVERDDVFDRVHSLVFELVEEGLVEGLRVDHIDGLYDPRGYCLRLRRQCPRPIYLIVEKILAPHEQLRSDWETDGTTGYEFAALLTRLIVDAAAEPELTSLYRGLTGHTASMDEVERQAKLEIIDYEMAAERDSLVSRLHRLAVEDLGRRDLTRNAIRNGLRHVVACMPVYRTYVADEAPHFADRRDIAVAVAGARRLAPQLDPAVFEFIETAMLGPHGRETEAAPAAMAAASRRIQQYTAPVMAKGLEDTALYRFNRLIALNEVGQRPDRFSSTVDAFHDFCRARAAGEPDGMLSTSSHDTKRGEDTRARIAAISYWPERWRAAVEDWMERLAQMSAAKVDPSDIYHFLQLMVGAWPTELDRDGGLDPEALANFRERLEAVMLKSIREARVHTNWMVPQARYEDAVTALVRSALTAPAVNPFLVSFRAFIRSIGLAGAANGLVVAALKLTAPGVPDIYQGAELWEQSMVDPDNRRPVDFDRRSAMLARLDGQDLPPLLEHWQDGEVKLALVARLLKARALCPDLFAYGSYEPVAVHGTEARRLLCFMRRGVGRRLLVAAALGPWPQTPEATMRLPDERSSDWEDPLRGGRLDLPPECSAETLLRGFPVSVLLSPSQ